MDSLRELSLNQRVCIILQNMILHNYAFLVNSKHLKNLHRCQTHIKLESTTNNSVKNYQIQDQSKCYSHLTISCLTPQFHIIMYHSLDQTQLPFIVSSYNLSIQYSYNLKTKNLASLTCKMTRNTQGV